MPFSQIIPTSPSPAESKRLFYTSVSLLLSCIQGYHYHLSKFHIYVLVYWMLFLFLAYFTLYNWLQFQKCFSQELIFIKSNKFYSLNKGILTWNRLPFFFPLFMYGYEAIAIFAAGQMQHGKKANHVLVSSWKELWSHGPWNDLGFLWFSWWRSKWQPIPVSLPGESQGQRSLADYSP